MDSELEALREAAFAEIGQGRTRIDLENLRVRFLGKSGAISSLSENMRNLPKEDRPRIGKQLNDQIAVFDEGYTRIVDQRIDCLGNVRKGSNLYAVLFTDGTVVIGARHAAASGVRVDNINARDLRQDGEPGCPDSLRL